MAATADPRAKPAPAPSTRHLEPWGHQQQGPRAHRAHPILHAVASASPMGGPSGSDGKRDRRRSSSHHRGGAAQVVGEEEPYGGGIEELRVKLMGHLRDAAEHLRVPQPSPLLPPPPKAVIPPPHTEEVEPEPEPEPELRAPPPPPPEPTQQPQVDVADRPWKLRERTRRRPAALTSWAGTAAPSSSSRRRRRATFSVSLAPEEIEEDIYALTGGRPRRRPRKRPRVVQRQLDSLFPGLWLTEITADAYRVQDDG